ncbi:MAG: Indole-3-glycerol-phosphate synthase [Firmicutes bacterium]|nr:Indole-3-glycerol-phosphate synthase [Bacillota bacterium]
MILDEIIACTCRDLEARKRQKPLENLYRQTETLAGTHGFKEALSGDGPVRIISEFKQASPSKGVIRADLSPKQVIADYAANGAAAISVLTEQRFFQGKPEFLSIARKVTDTPLLRKDFIVDEYQLVEARALGADAVLLIVAALPRQMLAAFLKKAAELQLDCLVEAHTRAELEIALESGAQVIGINNRNLYTFETSLKTTFELARYIPRDKVFVSESGINSRADIDRLADYGVNAALVGEVLMRSPSPGLKLRELAGGRT